ncbi:hypothetical protein Zm00014a_001185 [Zea mays]|uniref:Uncharacterized protein n=1 Tax=Zea mays TaxID=4577 RepID=A0A3L6F6E8_MAIZE|nr:hypothetical protein Zm00014a_001185 [Zea mays]
MGTGQGQGQGPAAPAPGSSASTAWQSPVPYYLFGGLAATLGLIALSLLALACSHWKLSVSGGSLLPAGGPDDGGLERQDGDGKAAGERWRERVLVIMAGDEMPTFLATPALCRGLDDARGGVGSAGGEEGRCGARR